MVPTEGTPALFLRRRAAGGHSGLPGEHGQSRKQRKHPAHWNRGESVPRTAGGLRFTRRDTEDGQGLHSCLVGGTRLSAAWGRAAPGASAGGHGGDTEGTREAAHCGAGSALPQAQWDLAGRGECGVLPFPRALRAMAPRRPCLTLPNPPSRHAAAPCSPSLHSPATCSHRAAIRAISSCQPAPAVRVLIR